MSTSKPAVILITGIMASGKSSVAQHLAERFDQSVHLRGDVFRRMIVKGREEMDADYSQVAYDQLLLRYQLAVDAAKTYSDAGFTVVYQDIILGPVLNDVVEMLRKSGITPHVVVLCPSPEVVTQREAARDKTGYSSWTPADLDQSLRSETPRLGLWLDTSTLTIEETVDAILDQLDRAAV